MWEGGREEDGAFCVFRVRVSLRLALLGPVVHRTRARQSRAARQRLYTLTACNFRIQCHSEGQAFMEGLGQFEREREVLSCRDYCYLRVNSLHSRGLQQLYWSVLSVAGSAAYGHTELNRNYKNRKEKQYLSLY
jgi:hypothetical protein